MLVLAFFVIQSVVFFKELNNQMVNGKYRL